MSQHESLEAIVVELVRRGLPADYAERTASEFVDHHRDLRDELLANGRSEPEAQTEASQRLGDPSAVINKTVRAYRRRYWCARQPLITFLLAPIPVLFATWFVLANLLWLTVVIATRLGLTSTTDAQAAFTGLPVAIKYVCIVAAFLIVPAAIVYALGKLARRAAVDSRWILVAGCLLGLFAGAFHWQRMTPGSLPKLTDIRSGQIIKQPHHDFSITMGSPLSIRQPNFVGSRPHAFTSFAQPCQLFLPIAMAGAIIYFRQQAARASLRRLDYC